MAPAMIDVKKSLESLRQSAARVSWSKIQQFERCPGNWFVENHAAIPDRSAQIDDSLHAIPGTLVQRLWEAIINERLYRRDDLNDPTKLNAWAEKQLEALFNCIAWPLEVQKGKPKEHWRGYFSTDQGTIDLAGLADRHGLDPALRYHLQPKFLRHSQLFALHGGKSAFLAKLTRTFIPTLAELERANLDLDGILAEAFVSVEDGATTLAGGIDFIWNSKRSSAGLFDDLSMLEDGYVMLDGKIKIGPTVELGQLEFYAAVLLRLYGKRPSRLGFLDYMRATISAPAFEDAMISRILERGERLRHGTEQILRGVTSSHAASNETGLLPISEVAELTFTPSKLACRFCGISENCAAAANARTVRRPLPYAYRS